MLFSIRLGQTTVLSSFLLLFFCISVSFFCGFLQLFIYPVFLDLDILALDIQESCCLSYLQGLPVSIIQSLISSLLFIDCLCHAYVLWWFNKGKIVGLLVFHILIIF